MHRLATVHARDNQPTTNDVTTQPISISASFLSKVRHLKIIIIITDMYSAFQSKDTEVLEAAQED